MTNVNNQEWFYTALHEYKKFGVKPPLVIERERFSFFTMVSYGEDGGVYECPKRSNEPRYVGVKND